MPKPKWKYILHADMDAFYASVEQLDNPSFRDKPLVVGGSPSERGVVAAASYEARQYGIRSAMAMRTALGLYPDLIRVSPRFARYKEVSKEVMKVFRRLTPLVEPLSLDEAYMDISKQVPKDLVKDVAVGLRETVKKNTGLAMTVGGGSSKTVAKIASQLAKPDGLLLVQNGSEKQFLEPLDVGLLWGVGPKTKVLLNRYNIEKIGDIAKIDKDVMLQMLGKRGEELLDRAFGKDPDTVKPYRETKSISSETTLSSDTGDFRKLESILQNLSDELSKKLMESKVKCKTVSLKLRLNNFTTFSRQTTLESHTDDYQTIFDSSVKLLQTELKPDLEFRLIGLGVSGLRESFQLSLFD